MLDPGMRQHAFIKSNKIGNRPIGDANHLNSPPDCNRGPQEQWIIEQGRCQAGRVTSGTGGGLLCLGAAAGEGAPRLPQTRPE